MIREVVLTILQAGVALVVLSAGSAKLADVRGFATTVSTLGVPRAWSARTARGVALAEIGVGALALAGIAGRVVGVLLLALTVGFVAVTIFALRWRPQARCRCFGALSESRFGPISLVRSVLLAAAAAVVVVGGHGTTGLTYGPLESVLLLAIAALFAVGCAAASTAVALMRKGAANT